MTLKAFFSVISGTFMLAGQALAQPYTFIPIDVHCPAAAAASACPAGLAPGQVAAQTSARGINSRGDIVGSYVAGGRQRGFLLADGQFTTLEFPVPVVRATIANGINARREIVGQYTAPVHDSSDNGDIYGCLHDHDRGSDNLAGLNPALVVVDAPFLRRRRSAVGGGAKAPARAGFVIPIDDVQSLEAIVATSTAAARFRTLLVALFGPAVTLGRTAASRDGIRATLGAAPQNVSRPIPGPPLRLRHCCSRSRSPVAAMRV